MKNKITTPTMESVHTYGIIGFPLSHSFSQNYFNNKFKTLDINAQYVNFQIENINEVHKLIESHPKLMGLNVTMPYKEQIIPFLDEIDCETEKIGAVNVVKIIRTQEKVILKGYNTDIFGFENSLKPLLKKHHKKALIFGTGGAARAVGYVLGKLNIEHIFVSRFSYSENLVYENVTSEIINEHKIVINTTPIGMYPNIEQCPNINFSGFTNEHLAYDLIYNPQTTQFLQKASENGATIKNGKEMLILQAEETWKIWNRTNTRT